MSRAIVTLAVGERCFRPWHRYLLPGWRLWCEQHHYALVVFDQLIDTTSVGRSRSPAWQKLLAMSSPELRQFDQVLWLDADVMLTPWAPDPLETHHPALVGMARDDGSPMASQPAWFKSVWSEVLKGSLGSAAPDGPAPFSYFDLWGFNGRQRPLFNTGVIAFSPRDHADLFLSIYNQWSDGGSGALYEMVPINLELQQRRLLQDLDSRYNRLFGVHHAVWRVTPSAYQRWQGIPELDRLDLRRFAEHLAASSFAIHFAGAHGLMDQLLAEAPLVAR